jgi:hypothetical protein
MRRELKGGGRQLAVSVTSYTKWLEEYGSQQVNQAKLLTEEEQHAAGYRGSPNVCQSIVRPGVRLTVRDRNLRDEVDDVDHTGTERECRLVELKINARRSRVTLSRPSWLKIKLAPAVPQSGARWGSNMPHLLHNVQDSPKRVRSGVSLSLKDSRRTG